MRLLGILPYKDVLLQMDIKIEGWQRKNLEDMSSASFQSSKMCTRKGINENTLYIHIEENDGLELGIIPHTRCVSGCTSLTLNYLIRQTPLLGLDFIFN